ncbi:hypothetical protein pb186bvf_007041 [Paramecium bursaria]
MIKLFILLITISYIYVQEIVYTVTSPCRCSQILSESDCNQKCKWNSTKALCLDRQCSDIKSNDTKYSDTFTASMDCDSTTGCSFINDTCQIVTGCEVFPDEDSCENWQNTQCVWNNNTCQPFQCNLTTADKCLNYACTIIDGKCNNTICLKQNFQDCKGQIETLSQYYCVWNGNGNDTGKCVGAQLTQCSDANSNSNITFLCSLLDYCQMSGGQCQSLNCQDLPYEKCSLAQGNVQNGGILCHWNGVQCQPGYDISQLSQDECYSELTSYQLTYNDETKQCEQCPGYANLIIAYIMIIFL